jgi:hypothetical protein
MAFLIKNGVIINDGRELIGVNTAGINTALYVGEEIQLDAQSGIATAKEYYATDSLFIGEEGSGGGGGGVTDYSEVTLSGLTPPSFNEVYTRQSTGFVLDTGTVSSGSALFHADSSYYYYVASAGFQPDSRVLIWSIEDNQWVVFFDLGGGNFTEGNVSENTPIGDGQTFNAFVTSSNFTADGRNVPQSSATIVYSTSGGGSGSGIGVTITANGNATFAGNVTVIGDVEANDINSTSDITKKTNVETITDALSKVSELRGVTFDWTANGTSSGGIIAQDVERVLPSLVKDGDDHKTVIYNGIIGLLVEAAKELNEEVKELAVEVKELKANN